MNNIYFLKLFFESWIEINPQIFYTYVLLDPRKPGKYIYPNICISFLFEPFYVGKGKGNRVLQHLNKKDYTSNKFKDRKINKIINDGMVPLFIKINENSYEFESFYMEKILILNIGRKNKKTGPLCNFTDGGEGASGTVISEETRKKHSNAMLGRKITWKDKISKSEKGRIIKLKQRKQISETIKRKIKSGEIKSKWKGRTHSEKSKLLISKKSKNMWNLNYDKMKRAVKNNCLNRTKQSYINGSEKTKKQYKITNLITEEVYMIKGLAEFCRNNNIQIRQAYQSMKRGHNCKSFRIERITQD